MNLSRLVRSRSNGVDVYRRRQKAKRKAMKIITKFKAPTKPSVVMAAHRQIERGEVRFFKHTMKKMREFAAKEPPAEPVKPMQPFPEIL